MFPSESLIEAGIYPKRGTLPANAEKPWAQMLDGDNDHTTGDGTASDWFKCFENEDLDDVYVEEEYIPVPAIGTLLTLLTLDEDDIAEDDEDNPEVD